MNDPDRRMGPSLGKRILHAEWLRVLAFLLALQAVFFHRQILFGEAFTGLDKVYDFAPWKNAYPGRPCENPVKFDHVQIGYPQHTFAAEALRRGEWPLWNPQAYAGAPFLANMQTGVFNPFNLFHLFFPYAVALPLAWAAKNLLLGLFIFLFLRALGASKNAGILAAGIFSFCGFQMVWMHYVHTSVTVWLPALFLIAEKIAREGKPIHLLLVVPVTAVHLFSGHPETSISVHAAASAYLLLRSATRWRAGVPLRTLITRLLAFALASASGALLASVQILPFLEYSLRGRGTQLRSETAFFPPSTLVRDGVDALAWIALASLVAGALFFLFRMGKARNQGEGRRAAGWLGLSAACIGLSALPAIRLGMLANLPLLQGFPDLYGHYAVGDFAGPFNYVALNGSYVGIVPLFLAGLALWRWRDTPGAGALALLAALSYAVLWQLPLFFHIHRTLPPFSLSGPFRIAVIGAFSLSCLAGIGFDALVRRLREGSRGFLAFELGAAAVILTAVFLAPLGFWFAGNSVKTSRAFGGDPARLRVEHPSFGVTVKGRVEVRGWAVGRNPPDRVEVLLDDKVIGEARRGIASPHLAMRFPAATDPGRGGVLFPFDTGAHPAGSHRLSLRGTWGDKKVSSPPAHFHIASPDLSVTSPRHGASIKERTEVTGGVRGPAEAVVVTVDGNPVARQPLSPPKEGKDPTPFRIPVDLRHIPPGSHFLEVTAHLPSGEILTSGPLTVEVLQADFLYHLGGPAPGSKISGNQPVFGWILSTDPVKRISLFLDGKRASRFHLHEERRDVLQAFPAFRTTEPPGFRARINLSGFPAGVTLVQCQAVLASGKRVTFGRRRCFLSPLPMDTWEFLHPPHKLPALAFLPLALTLAVFLLAFWPKTPVKVWRAALLALALGTLVHFGLRFHPPSRHAGTIPSTPAIDLIRADRSHFRVLGLDTILSPNLGMPFGLMDVRGHDGIGLERTSAFLRRIPGFIPFTLGGMQRFRRADSPLIDLLNVRYLLSEKAIEDPKWEKVFEGEVIVYRNRKALPRAFVVRDFRVLDEGAMLRHLASKSFRPDRTVLLEEDPGFLPAKGGGPPTDTAKILAVHPDRVTVKVTAGAEGFLFLGDNHYPGWRATVNGKEAKIFRANYAFRAVRVPEGAGTVVEFTYRPLSFRIGAGLSLFMLLLWGIGFAWILRLSSRSLPREGDPEGGGEPGPEEGDLGKSRPDEG
ncbi:MAG: YfhO family protein [Planctomycetota bacterium]